MFEPFQAVTFVPRRFDPQAALFAAQAAVPGTPEATAAWAWLITSVSALQADLAFERGGCADTVWTAQHEACDAQEYFVKNFR